MREHYLKWLADVRPDLSALHRARFRSGGYQEQSERDRISELVHTTARKHGVTGRRGRLMPDPPAPAEVEIALHVDGVGVVNVSYVLSGDDVSSAQRTARTGLPLRRRRPRNPRRHLRRFVGEPYIVHGKDVT